jgi:phosphatidylglycerol:prolipoprotein diacylglycerol transferase
MYIDGVYYQPTFLYESLWNIIGFIIILILRRNRYRKTGQLTGFYLMWYSFGRFFIEMLRDDSLMLGNIKVAVLVSGILFVVGLLMFIFLNKGSRFDRLYNEVEVNDVKF